MSTLTSASDRRTTRRFPILFGATLINLMLVNRSYAGDMTIPWECSTYSGEAQARCMQGLIEAQGDNIGKLEREIQSQQSQMGTLQEQLEQQSRAAADLQRQLDRPAAIAPAPNSDPYGYPFGYSYPYPSSYGYRPGIRFGLNFGGGPHLYGPGWGYRHWGHRW